MPTITSSPTTKHLTGPSFPPSVSFTFAIPSGAYSAGTWNLAADWTLDSSLGMGLATDAGFAHKSPFSTQSSPGGHQAESISATANQLTDINAAAGGSLTVYLYTHDGFVDGATDLSITSLTLDLTPTVVTPTVGFSGPIAALGGVGLIGVPLAAAIAALFLYAEAIEDLLRAESIEDTLDADGVEGTLLADGIEEV